MIIGRIVSGIAVWILATFFMAKLPGPILFITGSISKSTPGIIIQLVFIPALILILNKSNLMTREEISSAS